MSPRRTQNQPLRRMRFIQTSFAVVFCAILFKLYMVQIVHGDMYADKASRQYVGKPGMAFDRGSIFFTTKNGDGFSAAALSVGYIMALAPDDIKDPEKTYDKVKGYVDIDKDEFIKKAQKKGDPYEEVAKQIPQEVAEELANQKIPGVSLHEERWRYYPGNSLAAQTVGFMSYVGDTYKGAYGIESQYDSTLSVPTDKLYVNFFAEVFSGIQQLAQSSARTGDVYLTIEPTVQMNLEKVLENTHSEWGSKMVGGIVMNPKNGEIYALASTPSFNLNEFRTVDDPAVFTNPLVTNVYEMGSIVKPITVAAGLDAGVINPSSTYNDTGTITLDGKKFSNYDGKARGIVDMQTVLNKSLNTGVSYIVRQLGTQRFRGYLEDFGVREKSGIDLPAEGEGLTDNLDSPRRVEYATASFGQGFAINPIVMTRALAVLANGGKLVTPHVTKKIDYDIGMPGEYKMKEGKQIIKPETSETITNMLIKVVDEALVGGEASLDRWSIAAKTGTAQIAGPGGKYYQDKYLHTFFGYFPAYDPQFIVFLMNEEPKGAEYASQTLTKPFGEIAKFLLNYYVIPPDR